MLNSENRLKKRKSFNYIYKKGKHHSDDMIALVFVSARVKNVKLGFSVSKKVGNSVIRHRATRVMRAGARPLVDRIVPNNTIVFVAKEGIDKFKSQEVTERMEKLLKKAGLLI